MLTLQIYFSHKNMSDIEISRLAFENQSKASRVLQASGIEKIWSDAGCRVNLVGSLRMGLLMTHRDIDLHIYSHDITEQKSFAIAARMAADPRVTEIRCINGLHTDEHCVAWHATYRAEDNELWQFDIIHIEEGSQYDGYFEHMADRIAETMTAGQRDIILRLKYEAGDNCDFHGVEFYEAVIADGINTLDGLRHWVADHRKKQPYYWIP